MDIACSKEGSVDVVTLSGRLDAQTSGSVEERLNELLDAGTDAVIVDMSSVDYISSAGLRVLLAATKKKKERLRIAGIQPRVEQVISIAGLAAIFHLEATREEALRALST